MSESEPFRHQYYNSFKDVLQKHIYKNTQDTHPHALLFWLCVQGRLHESVVIKIDFFLKVKVLVEV